MTADVIQGKYEDLDDVAARFGAQVDNASELLSRVQSSADALQDGWEGRGKEAFFAEMHGEIYPAMQRLIGALELAQSVTLEIKQILQGAEEEASAPFRSWSLEGVPLGGLGGGVGGGFAGVGGGLGGFGGAGMGGLGGWSGGFTGNFGLTGTGNFGGGNPFLMASASSALPFGGGGDGLSGWASPFAAGASLLGPVPVPIPGMRVPAGYSNAGKQLWLYIGGSGTDTVFSVHPHAGWGRAPFKLPKPNLRFDYGVLPPSGKAFLLNGAEVAVTRPGQYFHWNVQGGMGLKGNNPLFKAVGGMVTHDHQLMRNVIPKPNAIGGIPGATLVKGASRGLFVIGAGIDAYNIATADNKIKETAKVAGGWGGAWVGAKGGAAIGAGIGSFFGPGPGTAIGGAVGGIAGGIGGYFAGSSVGETIYGWFD